MKRLTGVLTAALMLVVIATGCSKEENENMEEGVKLNKNDIVGVWANGLGEFVSFSSDGYVCVKYEDGIFQGEIEKIEGEYINVKGYFPEGLTVLFDVLGEFDGKSIGIFSISYMNGKKIPGRRFFSDRLTKTDDAPCVKSNKVLGGRFQQDGYEWWLGKEYRTISDYTIEDFYRIRKSVSNKDNDEHLFDIYVNYVYLPPYIYVKGHTSFDENGVEQVVDTNLSVYEVSFGAGGKPVFNLVKKT